MIEMPDRTVLRLRTASNCVTFIERDDHDAGGSPERWWLPSGDAIAWEQVQQRLDAAAHWEVVGVPVPVVDALIRLRAEFDEAMRKAQACRAGEGRAEKVQVALFVERAAQVLAESAGIGPVNWAYQAAPAAVVDDPTQAVPVLADAPTQVLPVMGDAPTEEIPVVDAEAADTGNAGLIPPDELRNVRMFPPASRGRHARRFQLPGLWGGARRPRNTRWVAFNARSRQS